jgi:glycosyltransferase involved in cell wall biosynthesis
MNRFLFRSVLTDIITNSREIKENIFENNPRIIDDEKVHIVYNGINLKNWPDLDFFQRSRHDGDVLILGNAGRLVEQKGHYHLIMVARHLKDMNLAFKLFIVGSGKLGKSLKKACKENQLEEEVVFLDFVENMTDFLKSLDIYLSTSLHEGSSHVVIEAMASGKPVIAFDVSSMPELVDNGETGFLIPFTDIVLFAEKIKFLNNNSSELERLGNNARAKVESNFNFAGNLQQVLNLIRT